MNVIPIKKPYSLRERTVLFAKDVRDFLRALPRSLSQSDDARQLQRSSGSIAANYSEADEALSKDDCIYRMKICRKESKESTVWLTLFDAHLDEKLERQRQELLKEAQEILLIFCAIVLKLTKKS